MRLIHFVWTTEVVVICAFAMLCRCVHFTNAQSYSLTETGNVSAGGFYGFTYSVKDSTETYFYCGATSFTRAFKFALAPVALVTTSASVSFYIRSCALYEPSSVVACVQSTTSVVKLYKASDLSGYSPASLTLAFSVGDFAAIVIDNSTASGYISDYNGTVARVFKVTGLDTSSPSHSATVVFTGSGNYQAACIILTSIGSLFVFLDLSPPRLARLFTTPSFSFDKTVTFPSGTIGSTKDNLAADASMVYSSIIDGKIIRCKYNATGFEYVDNISTGYTVTYSIAITPDAHLLIGTSYNHYTLFLVRISSGTFAKVGNAPTVTRASGRPIITSSNKVVAFSASASAVYKFDLVVSTTAAPTPSSPSTSTTSTTASPTTTPTPTTTTSSSTTATTTTTVVPATTTAAAITTEVLSTTTDGPTSTLTTAAPTTTTTAASTTTSTASQTTTTSTSSSTTTTSSSTTATATTTVAFENSTTLTANVPSSDTANSATTASSSKATVIIIASSGGVSLVVVAFVVGCCVYSRAADEYEGKSNDENIDHALGLVEAYTAEPSGAISAIVDQIAAANDEASGAGSPAGRALDKLTQIVPPPFNAPIALIASVFAVVQGVIASRAACQELSKRLSSLAPAIVALSKSHEKSKRSGVLTVRIAKDIEDVVAESLELIKQFAPSKDELEPDAEGNPPSLLTKFTGWCKRTAAAILNPAEMFEQLHAKITRITQDYQFASLVSMQETDAINPPPSAEQIRVTIRDELAAVSNHIDQVVGKSSARVVEETQQARDQIKNSISSLSNDIAKISTKLDKVQESLDANSGRLDTIAGRISALSCAFENLKKQDKYSNVFFCGDASSVVIKDQEKPLGKGGSGTVFVALMSGEQIAAKRLNADSDLSPEQQAEATCHEAKYIQMSNDPNVVRQFGILVKKPYTYILMERCVCPADSYLKVLGDAFPLVARVYFAHSIARVLRNLHAKQIVFCDMKTNNILISTSGHPRLTDFGSARSDISSTSTALIASGVTAAFAAPELRNPDARPTFQTDVYAFGVTLFELVTGAHFYLTHLTPQFVKNEAILTLILRCTSEDPSDRPSMAVVEETLHGLLSQLDGNFVNEVEDELVGFVTRYKHLRKQVHDEAAPSATNSLDSSLAISDTTTEPSLHTQTQQWKNTTSNVIEVEPAEKPQKIKTDTEQ